MRTALIRTFILAALCGGTQAWAGLYDQIYRGLELFATPSGFPVFSSGDGTRVNGARSGRLRIVPDRVGRGYTLELDRAFGTDSRGRPEILDLGPVDLQLTGAVQATMGYTSRGFLIGNSNITLNNLSYIARGKTGLQDAVFSGTLQGTNTLEVNQFGFYDMTLNLANSGSQLELDGVIVRNTEDLSFDLGPINIQGNVFFDMFVGLLSTFGVDTTALEQLSPKSPIDQINDAIDEAFRQNALVAGYSLTLGEDGVYELTPLSDLGPVPPSNAELVVGESGDEVRGFSNVPEPATIGLLVAGGLLYWRMRRAA